MKIGIDRHEQALVLHLQGELDAAGSAELERRCLYEQQEGALHFVFDLAALDRITGSGLRVLLGLARVLPRSGGSLVLCGLDAAVHQALQVSGLESSFDIAGDRAAALARSLELRSARARQTPLAARDAAEKIDYAIALLLSKGRGEAADR